MEQLDYIIILLYFLGLIAVSVVMSRKIKNSEDMFIAGRNSSWWLSGVSSYMTICIGKYLCRLGRRCL